MKTFTGGYFCKQCEDEVDHDDCYQDDLVQVYQGDVREVIGYDDVAWNVHVDWKESPLDTVKEMESIYTRDEYLQHTHEVINLENGSDTYHFCLIRKTAISHLTPDN